jgi:uncharacterized membrane protein
MRISRSLIQYYRNRHYSLCDNVCWFIVVLMWFILLFLYPSLPSTIPIHFSLVGDAHTFGDKSFIWLFPTITTLLHVGLSLLAKYPHTLNYTQDINDSNSEEQDKKAIRIVHILKVVVITIMSIILCITLYVSK